MPDDLQVRLDPATHALLDRLAEVPAKPIASIPVDEARAALKGLFLALDRPDVTDVESFEIEVPGPDLAVPVTVHRPRNRGMLPVAVYLHGGGWSRGDREMYDRTCRHYARSADCVVLNVEYRLAPEHRFPAGLTDAYAVVRWAAAGGASAYGADGTHLAVLGDSAGGNFAAAIALMARDDGIPLVAQGLIYPGVDLRPDASYLSRRRYGGGGYFLDEERLSWYIAQYLGEPSRGRDWRASPIAATSHAGVAPSFVLTAGCDPLCDEGEAYAAVLRAAGVPTELRRYDGTIHGFLSFAAAIPLGLDAQDWVADRLRAALHRVAGA